MLVGTNSLTAVLAALGRDDGSAVDTAAARANSNADATRLVEILANANPAMAQSIAIGENGAVQCSVCQRVKSELEPVWMISVDISTPRQVTLHGALKRACEPETHGDESAPIHECEKCGKAQPATKRLHPHAPWPSRLLVVLQRYTMDYPTMSVKKVTHRVAFPRQLDLPMLCETPLGGTPPPEYMLQGAVVHTGMAIATGAYSFETNPVTLALLGLDDKQAVQDGVCPNGATPYILVYTVASAGSAVTSMSASAPSERIHSKQGEQSTMRPSTNQQLPAQTEETAAGPSQRDCCCSVM
jgi:hypothetical protein